jgi:alpha-beta hydrolase superfamily lysophospholipase
MRRRLIAIAAAAGLVLAALPVAVSAASPAPPGLPKFYAVPSHWPSKKPGTYLKAEHVSVTGLNGTAWLVMYVSQAYKAKPVAVTGYVVVPSGAAPTGGWPVVAWSHGTNGMANPCAPSLHIGTSDIPVILMNAFLAKGWAFVASDYQGEGTPPGILPYIVGASAAEDTINLVRAALEVPGAHTSKTWVEWGHSEGGQTAMFVDHLAPTYGKGLQLMGVVAGAPPSQFSLIDTFLNSSPFAFYALMVAFGFHAYYGNKLAPLDAVLSKAGQKLLADVTTDVKNPSECTSILAAAVDAYAQAGKIGELQVADPFSVPAWKRLLNENDPGRFAAKSSVPLLIIQGGADEQIPVVSTSLLYNHLCALGQVAQRWIYPGQSHAGVIAPSFADMVQWMADRFAGGANPDPYVPTGAPGIVPAAQTCN